MSALSVESLPPGLLSQIEQEVWTTLKPKIAPVAWAWYAAHKDDKVTTIFHLYSVTVSSFGLIEYALTSLFGPPASA